MRKLIWYTVTETSFPVVSHWVSHIIVHMSKISPFVVVVISNPVVCDICVIESMWFDETKLFEVLWFLV